MFLTLKADYSAIDMSFLFTINSSQRIHSSIVDLSIMIDFLVKYSEKNVVFPWTVTICIARDDSILNNNYHQCLTVVCQPTNLLRLLFKSYIKVI